MENVDLINLNIFELESLIESANQIRYSKLKSTTFPYIDLFSASTNYGEMVEKILVDTLFTNLIRVTAENFDQITKISNKKIETKSIRMMLKGSDTSYESRAISIKDVGVGFNTKLNKYGGGLSTTTFQQVKPGEFDSMIGVLVYKDGMDVFILNSDKIPNSVKLKEDGKVYLSGQHKGNLSEGQINISDPILNENYLFSIYNNGSNTLLFDRCTKKTIENFNPINIEDI